MRSAEKRSFLGFSAGALILFVTSHFLASSAARSELPEGPSGNEAGMSPSEEFLFLSSASDSSVAAPQSVTVPQQPTPRKRIVIFFSRQSPESSRKDLSTGPHYERSSSTVGGQVNAQSDVAEERKGHATPHAGIGKDAEGCLSPSDQRIINGSTPQFTQPTFDAATHSGHPSTMFYEILFSCGRRTFGNEERTAICVQNELDARAGQHLNPGCMSCFAKSVACAVSNCRGACMLDTCADHCVQCSEVHCRDALLACTELPSLPPACTENKVDYWEMRR